MGAKKHHKRRNHQNWKYWKSAGKKDVDCSAVGDENTCNSDGCSWCESAAVRSQCNTLENAKKLPDAVFQCHKIDDEEERSESEDEDSTKPLYMPRFGRHH